jgi:F0F1-type ATP synthase membrane subunit b/b'
VKPSEINAAIKTAINAAEPLREQLKPYESQIEELKATKAVIVNAYGEKIRRVRDSGKVSVANFVAWRNSILAMSNEDDRCAVIDAKLTELGIV